MFLVVLVVSISRLVLNTIKNSYSSINLSLGDFYYYIKPSVLNVLKSFSRKVAPNRERTWYANKFHRR